MRRTIALLGLFAFPNLATGQSFEIVHEWQNVSVDGGQRQTFTLNCSEGIPISAGFQERRNWDQDQPVVVRDMWRTVENTGFHFGLQNTGDGLPGHYVIYVYCLKGGPTDGGTPDVAPTGALFDDSFSDGTLTRWVGKNEGSHSGTVVADPHNPTNQILTFTQVVAAGDVFSQPLTVTPTEQYALCFQYMGRPVHTAGAGNGGAIGIAAGTPGSHRWLAGTAAAGGIEQGILEDDGEWHSYRVEFYPRTSAGLYSTIRVMLEDFTGATGDVFFDDIKVVPASQDC